VIDARRRIPSVEKILESIAFEEILDNHPRSLVLNHLRDEVDRIREDLGLGTDTEDMEDPALYAKAVRWSLETATSSQLQPVINGTGVILHTNLGRAALARSAIEAMEGSGSYSNLEYDLNTGRRGSRYDHCTALLHELTGAESALVVNNCAAALVLALSTMARGRYVLVSRGELVEIGGGFRIPEIMRSSGALLKEVGSTNRTTIQDYLDALKDCDTALILKVHRSNFRITGFTEEVTIQDLTKLGKEKGIGILHDLGSGLMLDPKVLGLPPEPRPVDSLSVGVDLVAFSGDKLLGGPQAGILLGKQEWIDRMRRNPLCRALRIGKTTLLALEATLRLYRDPSNAINEIPTLTMILADPDKLRKRAEAIAGQLSDEGIDVDVIEVSSVIGGGTFPDFELESYGIRIQPEQRAVDELASALRSGILPLVGRVEGGAFWIDLRTVLEWQDSQVINTLCDHIICGKD
jgi:L-seryl-tRNA(Ser) seleniumtransferase